MRFSLEEKQDYNTLILAGDILDCHTDELLKILGIAFSSNDLVEIDGTTIEQMSEKGEGIFSQTVKLYICQGKKIIIRSKKLYDLIYNSNGGQHDRES